MDGKYDDEIVALAVELWLAAGALLRALHPPALAQLREDLARWPEDGPDWLDEDDSGGRV